MKTQNKPEKKNAVKEVVDCATLMVKAHVIACVAESYPIFNYSRHAAFLENALPEPFESIIKRLRVGEHVLKHMSYFRDAMSSVSKENIFWFSDINHVTNTICRRNFRSCYVSIRNLPERNKFLEELECFIANDYHKEYIWGLATMIVEHIEFRRCYVHLLEDAELAKADFSIDFLREIEKLPKKNREAAIKKFIKHYRQKIKETLSLTHSDLKDFMQDCRKALKRKRSSKAS